MFGSGKKNQKKKTTITIETMKDNLNGSAGRTKQVEYEVSDNNQAQNQNKQSPQGKTETKQINQKPQQTAGADFPSPSIGSSAEKKTETFSSNKATDNLNKVSAPPQALQKNIYNGEKSPLFNKKEKSLSSQLNKSSYPPTGNTQTNTGQTTTGNPYDDLKEKVEKIKAKEIPTFPPEITKTQTKRGGGRFIFVIVFILILASFLLGGYFLYMNNGDLVKAIKNKFNKKENLNEEPSVNDMKEAGKQAAEGNFNQENFNQELEAEKLPNGEENNDNVTPAEWGGANSQETNKTQNVKKEERVKFTIDPNNFEQSFNNSLSYLKTNVSEDDLNKGFLLTVHDASGNYLPAPQFLSILGLNEIISPENIKDICSVFVMKDSGKMRVAAVFELKEKADQKVLKDKILSAEDQLPAKLLKLFPLNNRPALQEKYVFKVNPNNYNARYVNYQPGDPTASVDWNIIDLGAGRILYFATSKKEAETLTKYFFNLVQNAGK